MNIGDLVKMSNIGEKQYSNGDTNPYNAVGIIKDVKNNGLPFIIKWSNGYENVYKEEELEIVKSFGVELRSLSKEKKLHLFDVVYERIENTNASKKERTIDLNIYYKDGYFGINNNYYYDWAGEAHNYNNLLTREQFLELFPIGKKEENTEVVKEEKTKPKRKTKAEYVEECKELKNTLSEKEKQATELINNSVRLEAEKDAINNNYQEALKEIEKLNKKLTIPKPKKLTTKRDEAWNDIIISDVNYNLLQFSFKSKQPLLLRGPSGTGKSSMVRALGKSVGVEVVEFNFNGDTTVEHLLGHKILVNGTMSWEDGPLSDAVRNGKIFIGHELNASSPEIQFILNGLLELNQGQLGTLSVQGNNGEVIIPHSNFRFYGTYNPNYLGTKMFGTSIMSRFVGIDIPPLSMDEEKILLLKKYPSQIGAINLLITLENNLRNNKDFNYDISTRDILQCLLFIDGGFSIQDAVSTCINNSLQLDIEKKILGDEINILIKQ